ncbi:hypothetical protein Ctha_2409 [Chloroherpeton thalassium ATCC 35110]|uniref:Uncharacterized protein n=1 Tax=Chloroherpeton thalassium (strain ATCC 35110 / GB-78) TaxID=517418 RepID=B3QX49_CHLT3|nr:hypothetical protein [Chloroherpeton thalassium]ACF14859.1 hypothetical protein Ctha_2409 [Chloroherpeton thalassium ATCC 35110]
MKKNYFKPKNIIAVLMVMVLAGFFTSIHGCGGSDGKNTVAPSDANTIEINGKVYDYETSVGIPYAKVLLLNDSCVTSSDGSYTFYIDEELLTDANEIRASAGGYIQNMEIFDKDEIENYSYIALNPSAAAVTIGSNGGNIQTYDNPEALNSSDIIELVIPKEALDGEENISVTPLYGNNVPELSPTETLGLLNTSTVALLPYEIQLNEEVELTQPLPLEMSPGTKLKLLRFDTENNLWEDSGYEAIVQQNGTSATANITRFGIYSVGISGDYDEEYDSSEKDDIDQSSSNICISDTLVYPDGIPDGYNHQWLRNVVEQNSLLSGRPDFDLKRCYSFSEDVADNAQSVIDSREWICHMRFVNWLALVLEPITKFIQGPPAAIARVAPVITIPGCTTVPNPYLSPAPDPSCKPVYARWVEVKRVNEWVILPSGRRVPNVIWERRCYKQQIGWKDCHEGGGGE